jgi:hypothetical protein
LSSRPSASEALFCRNVDENPTTSYSPQAIVSTHLSSQPAITYRRIAVRPVRSCPVSLAHSGSTSGNSA